MSFKYKHKPTDAADLDITSFMNLMIVLVPVLLLSITFTQISVHEIKLPDLTGGSFASDKSQPQLEVVVNADGFSVYYPNRQTLVKNLPMLASESSDNYDYDNLSLVLQEIKTQLSERTDILVMADTNLGYQNLVLTMDTVKSYRTVLAASVVEVELFPEISLGEES